MEIFIIALISVLALILVVIAVICVYMFRFAIVRKKDLFVTAETNIVESDPELIKEKKRYAYAQRYETINIRSFDGLTLGGQYLPADMTSDKLMICFHGWRSNALREYSPFVKFFHDNGFNVLLVSNRAHGFSEGKYICYGVLDRFDCKSWCEYALNRFGENVRIYLHGVSMGGATVLMASGLKLPKNVCAIIADCAFCSPDEQFKLVLSRSYHLPPFPIIPLTNLLCKILAHWSFREATTRDAVKSTKIPIMFVHGEIDSFIPIQSTLDNYEACGSPKALLTVKNASHALSYYLDTERYEKEMLKFTEAHSEPII